MADKQKIWFPAKRYGWGWGLPVAWQGWLVLGLYIVLALMGQYYLKAQQNPAPWMLYMLVLTGLLIIICWYKGEPPKWHWGNKD